MMSIESGKRLLSIKETSEILNIKVGTLYNWIYEQKIKHIKVGRLVRFSQEIIDEFIKTNTIQDKN